MNSKVQMTKNRKKLGFGIGPSFEIDGLTLGIGLAFGFWNLVTIKNLLARLWQKHHRRGGPMWPPARRATTQGCPYNFTLFFNPHSALGIESFRFSPQARRSSSHDLGVTLLESRRRRDGPQGPPGRSIFIPQFMLSLGVSSPLPPPPRRRPHTRRPRSGGRRSG